MIGLDKYLCPLTVVYLLKIQMIINCVSFWYSRPVAYFLVVRTVTGGLFAFLDSILIFISVVLVLNLTKKFERIFLTEFE